MTFYDNGDDVVESHYTIPALFQGYPGIVHGGVQASILDEIAGRISLIEDMHAFMMSVRLDVKYRHPVPTDEPLHILAKREYLSDRYGQAPMYDLFARWPVGLRGICEAGQAS